MSPTTPARPDGLTAYGWNAAWAQRYAAYPGGTDQMARIVRVDRGSYLAATWAGLVRCMTPTGDLLGAAHTSPQTGDFVTLAFDDRRGATINAVLPRHTAIVRADPAGTGDQVLVANVDQVLIVTGLDRPIRLRRMERALVIVRESGASPVVVLTKSDLVNPSVVSDGTKLTASVAPGVAIVVVSAVTGRGLAAVRRLLRPGTTVALLGESGAGKSTLINALLQDERQATGPTRSSDHRGRHTTTSRDLIPVPSGAVLVDTPGLRSIGLSGGDRGLAATFEDVTRLAAACRFRDCRHASEPGCAVRRAINDGQLTRARVDSYLRLGRELAHEARRARARERKQERGRRRMPGREAWRAEEW